LARDRAGKSARGRECLIRVNAAKDLGQWREKVAVCKNSAAAVARLALWRYMGVHIMWELWKEFFLFLREEKKWWLFPLVAFLLILGAIIVFSSSSVLAPFMYPFM
jgi:hypothetical protein